MVSNFDKSTYIYWVRVTAKGCVSGPTREQVIKWAADCGAFVEIHTSEYNDFLVRFATLAYKNGAMDENEACQCLSGEPDCLTRIDLEDAIRARGKNGK